MYNTKQKVLKIIHELTQEPIDSIDNKSFEELGISSLDAVSIVFEIEESFGISVPDDIVYEIKDVNDLILRVNDYLATEDKEA